MRSAQTSPRGAAASWLTGIGLAVGLVVLVLAAVAIPDAGVQAAGTASVPPPQAADFVEAAPQGFGNADNEWAWSMAWWNGYLYVGTSLQFGCADQLARARNSFGLISYPPADPDVSCPDDPLDIDMRAEIWRWHADSDTWERVYRSPLTTVSQYKALTGSIQEPELGIYPITPTLVARDLGYRGMTVFQEPDGSEALYVTTISPKFVGYEMGPPRILRSTDGRHFTPLPMDPGTFLGDYTKTSIRNPITHIGSDGLRRLYVQGGSSRGAGEVLEAVNPAAGNSAFRLITPSWMQVSALSSFNGQLYLGMNDYTNGFRLFRVNPDGGGVPYPHTTLIENGGYLPSEMNPNNELLSMRVFQDWLYLGGNGVRLTGFGSGNLPAELFRIDAADHWDVIVGAPRADTPDGPKTPLSGFGPGFGNDLNGHMWRMSVYEGQLYVSTLDTSYAQKDSSPSPALIAEMGFDLWRSADGIAFTPVTTDSFSANIVAPGFPRPDLHPGAFDVGGRTQAVSEYGFFLGTVNPYQGLRVWQTQIPPASIVLTAPATAAANTPVFLTAGVNPPTATVPLTYTWEATDQAGLVVQTGLLTDTVAFTWTTPGSKQITVTATNQAGATLSQGGAVTVLAPAPNAGPASLTLSGPTDGLHYESYRFTASVAPLTATQPLTFVWQVTDHSPFTRTGGVVDAIDLSWESDGVKTVSVEVRNAAGILTATQLVGVAACTPISSVRLVPRPGGETYDNGVLIVEAVVDGGQIPFIYAWQLNDGPVEFLGNRYLLAGTGPGVQVLTVQVTNLCSAVNATLPVLVTAHTVNQVELSTSSSLVRPGVATPGEPLTYTLFLRNTNELPLTTTVILPIPAHTSFVPGSAESSLGAAPVLENSRLVWSGPVRPGITTVMTYSVLVDADATPGATIEGMAHLGSGKDLYNIHLGTDAIVAADFGLAINDNALVTAVPTVTLRYDWDQASDITEVRFSNDAGFGSGGDANTTAWLPVNPADPVIADWSLATSGVAFPPRQVYAAFRNTHGRQVGPVATAAIVLDEEPPFITSLVLDLDGATMAENVPITVIAFAGDNLSGATEIQLSHTSSFDTYSRFAVTGNSTLIAWNLMNGIVYGRARDRAGNLSAVVSGQFVPPDSMTVTGPATGPIGTLLSFTAVVSPNFTTRPITFTWQATGQPVVTHVVDGPSNTVGFTWLSPGQKTVQVTAVNIAGSAVGSAQVVIQVPEIAIDPTTFEVFATVGEVVTAPLTIDNLGAGTLNWSASELPPKTWLSISPSSGSVPGNASEMITVTWDASGLMPTTYVGALRVSSNDADEGVIDIPYTFHVLPLGPQLNVNPNPITATVISGQTGGASAIVKNVGDQTLGWSVTVDPPASWLGVAPTSGILLIDGTVTLNLTLNAGALAPGVYDANLRFESNDSDDPVQHVPVHLTVTPAGPAIELDPTSFDVALLAGTTVTRALTLSNGGDDVLDWSTSESPSAPWLAVAPASGSLPAGNMATLDVVFDGDLAAGTYTTTLVFASNDPLSPSVSVPIRLDVVASAPDVTVLPSSFALTLAPTQSVVRVLTIQNAGNAPLNWTLAEVPGVGWLSLSSGTGSVAPGDAAEVFVTIDAAGLSLGQYATVLRLQSNDPDQPSLDVTVDLEVVAGPPTTIYLPAFRH